MTVRRRLTVLGTLATAASVTTAISLSGLAAAGSSFALKDDKFAPTSLTVSKGTKVTFTWKGKHPHDVHATGAASFKSKIQTSGSYRYTFRKKGTVKLVCDVHPGMKATIKVK